MRIKRFREHIDKTAKQCGEACPDCPEQCKPITSEDLKNAMHVHPGPAVMVNPVIINDTFRQSPKVPSRSSGAEMRSE